jgi:TRAP-type C4-dicarboxylate transport system substrate-binding protein
MKLKTNARKYTMAMAAALVAAWATAAAAETTWKAHIWGVKRASSLPLEWYAKELAAKTGGQMKLELMYDKGTPAGSADLIRSGAAEAVYFCAQYFPDKMPLSTVLDLPMFSPDDLAAMGRITLALAEHPAIQAELRSWNTKMLLPVPLPQYQLMGTRRVTRIDDLKGAKVRISGEMGKILQEYGAIPSIISSIDSAAALKDGSLDLVALPYPYAFAAFKVHESSKYVTEKISLGGPLCYVGASQKAWDALPAGVQKVMLGLREPMVARYADAYAPGDAANIASFKERGLEFVAFNPADRARLVAKAIKVWQGWVEEREKQGLRGREVFEFAQGKIREFTRK